MAENALLKVLLDEGSYLPFEQSNECGVEAGLGTVLSRPVSTLLFSQKIKNAAAQKIAHLLDKTLSTGTPLLMLFSDCERTDASFSSGEHLSKLVRLSGVCPVLALVEKEAGDVAQKVLPFADFSIFSSGMHDGTCSTVQTLDLPAGVEYMRTLLSFLPLNCAERAPLLQLIEKKHRTADANGLIASIADAQTTFEIYRDVYSHVCFARINGRSTGVLWCEKGTLPQHAARFIQFCDCYSLPLLLASEEELKLSNTQLFMLAKATAPKLFVGNAGEYRPLFDLTISLDGAEGNGYDLMTTKTEIRSSVCTALELLNVKRDVLPPHKHGNMPV